MFLLTNPKKQKGDKAYEHLGYMKSANYYQDVQVEKHQITPSMMTHLANSYRLNGETEAAEYWYARYINNTTNAEDYLHYSQMLYSNGKCEDALRWYNKYKSSKGSKGQRDFIEDCAEMATFPNRKNVVIKNVASLNSEQLDFSPVPFKNGVLFTSNRKWQKLKACTDTWTNGSFADLYFAEKTGENEDGSKRFADAVPFSGKLNGDFHDGTATFSPDGQSMYFTRNSYSGKASNDVVRLQLYSAKAKGENWTDVQKLPFNSEEFASCHPSLSTDGSRLYFASDRPGGFGGMDIYVSKNENGSWSEPMNLGPEVNTEGNEIFPFMGKDKLHFSSDGHRGLGGLDIFSVAQNVMGDDNTWSNRKNMGQPINSQKDDFAFNVDGTNRAGYFTSNRPGGLGEDDIYFWKKEGEDEPEVLTKVLCVYDEKSGDRLSESAVNVTRIPCSTNAAEAYTTDDNGTTSLPIVAGESYQIQVIKDGYVESVSTIKAEDLFKMKEHCIPLDRKAMMLRGKVLIDNYNALLPGAKIRLLEKCSGQTLQAESDANGSFEFPVKCDCDYELIGSKEKFSEDRSTFKVPKVNCDNNESVEKELRLKLEEKGEVLLVEINDIYYNFDKSDIRLDADMELMDLVSLMNQYPSLTVELRAHTDSRGSHAYNEALSERRAKEARDFIIKHGIDASRVVGARGYGESQLSNHCSDGVKCTEEEHQRNRRTEIKVVRFQEEGVRIKN